MPKLPDAAAGKVAEVVEKLPDHVQEKLNEQFGFNPKEIAFFGGLSFPADFSEFVGIEPYMYDGENVVLLTDLAEGAGSSSPSSFFLFDNLVFFSASGPDGDTLYAYDGVAATALFYESGGTNFSLSQIDNFTEFGGDLYFTAITTETGREIFKYDGSTGVIEAIDLNPGPFGSNPSELTVFNGELYFIGVNDIAEQRLFKLDGAGQPVVVEGTNGIVPIVPSGNELIVFDGSLYFGGITDGPVQLLKLDGGSGEVVALDSTDAAGMSDPANFFIFGGDLYFAADRGDTGTDVFKLDGGTGEIVPVEVAVGLDSSSPSEFFEADGNLFVLATTAEYGREIYMLDEASGTWSVIDVMAGPVSSLPADVTEFQGDLYFEANDGSGTEIHGIDGASGATLNIQDVLEADTGFDQFDLLGSVDGNLLLTGVDDTFTDWGLVSYDGISATIIEDDLFLALEFTTLEGTLPIA